MLDLYRFNFADMEDVVLQDRSKSDVYDEGQWLSPVGNAAQEWTMSASGSVNTDDPTRLSKILFMEKGRTDAKAVGKMTCVSGAGVRGRTDVFLTAEGPTMTVGKALTLKKDTDNVVKLALASTGDVVKAHVFMKPADDRDGALHFELVTAYVL
jgi:hypothetical protein